MEKIKVLNLLAAALLTACGSSAQADESSPYTVTHSGFPGDFEGYTAYIVDYDNGEKLDSAIVVDGSLTFKGTISNPVAVRLLLEGNRLGSFVLEPGDIVVTSGMATGTKLNNRHYDYVQSAMLLNQQYQQASSDSVGKALKERIFNQYVALTDSVMHDNIDNPVGYFLFLEGASEMSVDDIRQAMERHPSLAKSVRLNKIIEAANRKEMTSPGHKVVDFEVAYGDSIQRFSDYVGKGKPVLVDFWASWCGPCIRQTPVLKDLLKQYGPQGLEVLGVAVWDKPEDTLRGIEQHQLPWPQIIDAQTIPTDIYGISGIPCIMLIAPDGTIISRDKQGDDLKVDVRDYFESLSQK